VTRLGPPLKYHLPAPVVSIFGYHAKRYGRIVIAMCALALVPVGIAGSDLSAAGLPSQPRAGSSSASGQKDSVGNEACAKCHASIYDSYEKTPMAHASGPAIDNLIAADFTHKKSGVHYRIYKDGGRAWLSFDRDGPYALHGKRELLYYIGSGRRGLTYLFSDDGYVFESPINWYGDRRVWDMTPAYQNDREAPLNLPVNTSCLHCHVSGMRPPLAGSENRYAEPLLTHVGVSCERCHGPGNAHINGGAIVNPARLSPERRDAICMQCHMEGRVSIERAGKHVYEFRPGDSLSDYIRYYVQTGSQSTLGAVSQVEALAQSACKKKSGDAMSCISCHDPHSSPSAEEKVSYFRGKCLACHGEAFAAKHHLEQKDCTLCHMPASASKDVAHTEVTDHRIPRVPNTAPQLLQDVNASAHKIELKPFPDSPEAEDDLRDFALAWDSLANSGVEGARSKAVEMLRRSLIEFPNDAETLSELGYEEQVHGKISEAKKLYERALASDPNAIGAATNLGVINAEAGKLSQAVGLLRGAFERAPGRSRAGMDLAKIFCLASRPDDAKATVVRVLEFNPDLGTAKQMLDDLNKSGCGN
jgi:tetratricopeptide repeat protein/cytochrome c554/c'-like protein